MSGLTDAANKNKKKREAQVSAVDEAKMPKMKASPSPSPSPKTLDEKLEDAYKGSGASTAAALAALRREYAGDKESLDKIGSYYNSKEIYANKKGKEYYIGADGRKRVREVVKEPKPTLPGKK